MGLRTPGRIKLPVDDMINQQINNQYLQAQANQLGMAAGPVPEDSTDLTVEDPQAITPLTPALEQQYLKDLADQRQYVEGLKGVQQAGLGQSALTDLSPLAGLVDTWTGSKLASHYAAPKSNQEAIDKLQKTIVEAQQGLSKEQRQYLKDKIAAQTVKPTKYQYMQNENGEIVGINPANPAEVVPTGTKGYHKPEEPKNPQLVTGYVAKGTDQPAYRSPNGGFVDASGRPIEVEMKPEKTPLAQQNSIKEVESRQKTMLDNIADLKKLVKNNGTFELFGPESQMMDSKITQLAQDYAKIVDPQTAAREGEVELARKSFLPIRGYMGLGVSNETAMKLIEEYEKDVKRRAKNTLDVYRSGLRTGTPSKGGLTPSEQSEMDALEQQEGQ